MLVRMWNTQSSFTHADGRVRQCGHVGKQFGSLTISYKVIHLPYDPDIALSIPSREIKICIHTKTCTQTYVTALFAIAKTSAQCPSTSE